MRGFKKTERSRDPQPGLARPAGRQRISPRMLKKFIKGIRKPGEDPGPAQTRAAIEVGGHCQSDVGQVAPERPLDQNAHLGPAVAAIISPHPGR